MDYIYGVGYIGEGNSKRKEKMIKEDPDKLLKQVRFIEDVNSGKCKLKSTVQLEDGRIVGIGANGKDEGYVAEFIDGKWTLPRGPVFGADFYEGKPIKIDLSENL